MNKLINILHKFEGVAVKDIQAMMAWMQAKTPEAVNAFVTAHNITQAFVNEAKSPTGATAEAVLASVLPSTAPFYPVVIGAAQKLADAFSKIATDIPAVEGVAYRYAGEIILAIDATAGTIDHVLMEFQKLFTHTA